MPLKDGRALAGSGLAQQYVGPFGRHKRALRLVSARRHSRKWRHRIGNGSEMERVEAMDVLIIGRRRTLVLITASATSAFLPKPIAQG